MFQLDMVGYEESREAFPVGGGAKVESMAIGESRLMLFVRTPGGKVFAVRAPVTMLDELIQEKELSTQNLEQGSSPLGDGRPRPSSESDA